jgi:hypothetical protein
MLIASNCHLVSNMDISKWFVTYPVGVDGTSLNPERITVLEEILVKNYGPQVSLVSMERLKSRKNIVVHLKMLYNKAPSFDLVAKMFVVDRFDIELQMLKASWENSITVPKVVDARDGVILMDFIPGEPLVDILNQTFDTSLIELLAQWYHKYHSVHGMIKGDPRLRNFIHQNGRIYGVDYEETRPGPWILDIGGIAASLLDTDPIFDIRKRRMCWTLFETYLTLIGEKKTPEIETAFNKTVADTLKQTAIWRKDDRIMSLSESVRENGIPLE